MGTAIFIRKIISILAYWLVFNQLYILCDIRVISSNITNINLFGYNHSKKNELVTGLQNQPLFESNQNENLTVLENESVLLKCAVRHKGNKTVSWLRKEDIHILTSEVFVFSGDSRFMVVHPQDSIEWNLKIDHATVKDSGFYECQVNTEPKIKLSVHLEVTVPEVLEERAVAFANSLNGKIKIAKISGSSELHIKAGSTISLTCTVNHQVPSIQWYHNHQLIEFNSNRGGINLETEKSSDGTVSILKLTRAQLFDSGNFTCVPIGAISASTWVHAINDEYPAAKYMSSSVTYSSSFCVTISCATIFLISIFQRFAPRKFLNLFFS